MDGALPRALQLAAVSKGRGAVVAGERMYYTLLQPQPIWLHVGWKPTAIVSVELTRQSFRYKTERSFTGKWKAEDTFERRILPVNSNENYTIE